MSTLLVPKQRASGGACSGLMGPPIYFLIKKPTTKSKFLIRTTMLRKDTCAPFGQIKETKHRVGGRRVWSGKGEGEAAFC